MQLICVTCNAAYAGIKNCPGCGERLVAPQEAHVQGPTIPMSGIQFVDPPISSRVIYGALVAFGIAYGLVEVSNGLIAIANKPEIAQTPGRANAESFVDLWWYCPAGLLLFCMIRICAGIFGGLLAGAGRAKSSGLGLMAGGAAAFALIAINIFAFKKTMNWMDYLSAGLLAGFGSAAAAYAGRIWPAKVDLPEAQKSSKGSSILKRAKDLDQVDKKIIETNWVRVMLGVSITVCAFLACVTIRNFLSQGGINLGSKQAIPISSLIIFLCISFLATATAGAGTGIGLRQGVYTGLIAGGIIFMMVTIRGAKEIPPAAAVFDILDMPINSTTLQQGAAALFGLIFILSTFSGAFGNTLFPPLKPATKSRRNEYVQQVYAE